MMDNHKRVAAYINLDAVEANLDAMKANISENTMVAAVIKTDGYGHGALPIAKAAQKKEYIWGFATATTEEAMELKINGIWKPILILGYTFPETYPVIVANDIRPTVFSMEMAEAFSREAQAQKKEVSVHVKVDTGMSRIGFSDTQESVEILRKIQQLPGIKLEGLFTHFAKADEAEKASVNRQIERYQNFVRRCEEAGVVFPIYHASNSAGIFDLQESNYNMVRAGIAIYGLYPSQEVKKDLIPLIPALELKSHVIYVKEIDAGTQVSYGGTYTAEGKRRIATIPVGYGDGYPRSLSNKGYVLIRGKKAAICGRICMDQFMVDVTDIPETQIGDEVTLIGKDGKEEILIDDLGELSGRFNYEFACDLSKRIPRIYLQKGNVVSVKDSYRK